MVDIVKQLAIFTVLGTILIKITQEELTKKNTHLQELKSILSYPSI